MSNALLLQTLLETNRGDESAYRAGRPPVWLMRQAGRYMPSYQKIRKNRSLAEMFREVELITEVTLLPVEELGVDGAILFSDILLILQALGLAVSYGDRGVDVATLQRLDDERLYQDPEAVLAKLDYIPQSIRELRKVLKVPLMGFVAAPFTLSCYALDGSKAALASSSRLALWTDPKGFEQLQTRLSDYLFHLAQIQVQAGAQILQLFDSHTHVLSKEEFGLCVLPVLQKFMKRLEGLKVPLVYFSKASQLFMDHLETLGPCAFGIDWQSDLSSVQKKTRRVLQGNFNPWKLLNDPASWKPQLLELLRSQASNRRYICSLGHGVLPQTPYEHVRHFIHTVLEFRD